MPVDLLFFGRSTIFYTAVVVLLVPVLFEYYEYGSVGCRVSVTFIIKNISGTKKNIIKVEIPYTPYTPYTNDNIT